MKFLKLFEEMGPKIASKAFSATRDDERSDKLKRDVITHLFRNYIGRNIPFYVKTAKFNTSTKYTLIEVEYEKSYNYNEDEKGNLILHFSADNVDVPSGAIADDSPYCDSKKDIIMNYSISKDNYIHTSAHYFFNQYAVNFLIKAANIIRNVYFNAYPDMIDWKITPRNEDLKKSNLRKDHFRMFTWTPDDMLNR